MVSSKVIQILFLVTLQRTQAQSNLLERKGGSVRGSAHIGSRSRTRALPNARVRQEVLDELRRLNVGNNEDRPLEEPLRDRQKDKGIDKNKKRRSKEGGPDKGVIIPKKRKPKFQSEKGAKRSKVKGKGKGGQTSLSSFNLADCDSYSNDWLFELAETCDDVGDEWTDCQCTTAGRLLDSGELTCATVDQRFMTPPACPSRCPVCELCMVLVGCEDIYDEA